MRCLWLLGMILLAGLCACNDKVSSVSSERPGGALPPLKPIQDAVSKDADHPFEIAGRVLDARGEGWPDEQIRLRLQVGEERWEQTVRPDGSFSFGLKSAPESAGLWMHRLRGDWRWINANDNHALPLTPGQLAGSEPIVLRIAERRRGRPHGLAVDRSSGEVLPYLSFVVTAKRPGAQKQFAFDRIEVQTDGKGRFRIEEELIGGLLEIRVPHGDPQAGLSDCLTDSDLDGAPWVIEFGAGPQLRFSLSGETATDFSNLEARIIVPGGANPRYPSPLHQEGPNTWMWPGVYRRPFASGSVLAVGTKDGLAFGYSVLEAHTEGGWRCDPIELHATGRLILDIDLEPLPRAQGAPFDPTPAWPLISITPSESDRGDPTWEFRADTKQYLNPGTYSLTVTSRSHVPSTRDLQIPAGEMTRLKVDLKLESNTRTLQAVVRTQSGKPLHDFQATLEFAGAREGAWYAEYHAGPGWTCGTGIDHFATIIEGSNDSEATFYFEYIPLGDLKVSTSSSEHACKTQLTPRGDGTLHLDIEILDTPTDGQPNPR